MTQRVFRLDESRQDALGRNTYRQDVITTEAPFNRTRAISEIKSAGGHHAQRLDAVDVSTKSDAFVEAFYRGFLRSKADDEAYAKRLAARADAAIGDVDQRREDGGWRYDDAVDAVVAARARFVERQRRQCTGAYAPVPIDMRDVESARIEDPREAMILRNVAAATGNIPLAKAQMAQKKAAKKRGNR